MIEMDDDFRCLFMDPEFGCLLAIDPGHTESGWVIIHPETKLPMRFGKTENQELLADVVLSHHGPIVIEKIHGMGMAVGQEVFDTCIWIGRFYQTAELNNQNVSLLKRHEVKKHLCGSMQAKDPNIIQALVDRFAYGERNKGKGTKTKPGWFYGFAADVWQAYALGITYLDKEKK